MLLSPAVDSSHSIRFTVISHAMGGTDLNFSRMDDPILVPQTGHQTAATDL